MSPRTLLRLWRHVNHPQSYWTIVSEMEVPSLKAFEEMFSGQGDDEKAMKEFEKIMDGYHDLVEHGRREIYKIEG